MTEPTPEYQADPPTALDTIVAQRRTETSVMKQVNATMYGQLLSETAELLHGTAQLTQDVLHQVCVEHNSRPNEVLSLVHDYLATFAAWQEHEVQPPEEPVQESLFFAREES